MSKQGWLKREIETVQREVATWPAWKRGEGMDDVKRYKLSQDARYGDGAFVIPAGQVMVREADYDALREQNRVLREALEKFCKETEYVASRMAYQCGLGAGEWESFIDQTNYYKQYKQGKTALTATSQPVKPAGKMHACDIPGCVSCGNPEDATSQEGQQ